MKFVLLVAGLCLASAAASVVPVKGERKLADADFLKRQKQVLDLYVGLGYDQEYQNEYADFDFAAHSDYFTDSTVAKKFVEVYKKGFLPKNAIFSLSCHRTRYQARRLFDVFYFAKDFETFYKVASWAKKFVNPLMFSYAYTLALQHREDCYGFSFPPFYEVFPNYFVPQDTMHNFYKYKMTGVKEGKVEYNNTGYEYNYHSEMFGGALGLDISHPHVDYKVSYFREDVGLNSMYPLAFRFPTWWNPKYYNAKGYFRRGEQMYYFHQQLFARYTLERLANGLPFVEPLDFNKPIDIGYNPRIGHLNGESFIARPDGFKYYEAYNQLYAKMADTYEHRVIETIDFGGYWNATTDTLFNINNYDGIDALGKLVFGLFDEHDQTSKYYGNYYYSFLHALGYATNTKDSYDFNGGVTTLKLTTLRDPAYYNFLARLMAIFQKHKMALHPYTSKDLKFPGVSVTNFEVDKLVTYFDMFDFEVSNGISVNNPKEYNDYKYQASQFRLNHKPFNYKISVNSDAAYDGMVRVFVGPKFDSEEHVLTLSQKRLAMVEIDRFPVKISAGQNVFERNSKESPIFAADPEGFRSLYQRIDHALKTNEPYYINEKVTCGAPQRLQLPRGWKSGLPYTFSVVVTPFDYKSDGHETVCGSSKLYDQKPYGYPFDRPIYESEFHVPNIYFKDEFIYHKDDFEVNRST